MGESTNVREARNSAGVRQGSSDAEITDDFEIAGVPDSFQRLWTPYRMAYIKAGQGQVKDEESCPFCIGPNRSDEDSLIVHRGKTAYVILNLFPYNPGHLLICPYRHVPDYTDITEEETAEMAALAQKSMRVLRAVSRPTGFNLGMNQGVTGEPALLRTFTNTWFRVGPVTGTSSRSSRRPRPFRRLWVIFTRIWLLAGWTSTKTSKKHLSRDRRASARRSLPF